MDGCTGRIFLEVGRVIYTVTFNPSMDYIITVKDFALGRTNRTVTEQMLPGGKGLNVSTVLANLGMESTALGFVAGFIGEEIVKRVRNLGFVSEFIRVPEGFSRINIKMKDFDGTEINGKGPVIGSAQMEQFWDRLDQLKEGDILVLAGSIPASMPESLYRDIMSRLSEKGILFVVDATGELLLNVLEYDPFLIKPNNHELGELFGVSLKTRESVVPYARMLQERGARNVLVSMAGQGAVLVDETGEVYQLPAPKGTMVNAVGAGDSMVAGFLAGWLQKKNYLYAFKMGIAAGSASAFSELLATEAEIKKVYDSLE